MATITAPDPSAESQKKADKKPFQWVRTYSNVGSQLNAFYSKGDLSQDFSSTNLLANVVGDPNVHVSSKQQVCIDMLVKGFVHSFVDFFYLTHEKETIQVLGLPPPGINPDTNLPEELKEVPADLMQVLRLNLTRAEQGFRDSEYEQVFKSYKAIASAFFNGGNSKVALHFHNKALSVAKQIENFHLIGDANKSIGEIYQALGDSKTASTYFEEYLDNSKKEENKTDEVAASQLLVNSYMAAAKRMEMIEDHEQCIVYLKKCISCAQNCDNLKKEGEAHFKLGEAYRKTNQLNLATIHLEKNLEMLKGMKDIQGAAVTCSALASVFQITNPTAALQMLEENIELATSSGQTFLKAQAFCDIGIFHTKQGHHEKAVEFFTSFLEVATTMEDVRLRDRAKVLLGVARGNLAIKNKFNVSVKWNSPKYVA
jgi:tetratricopeptide (TPR) repeat protein